MPLLIYTIAPSLYCAKLRILLRHKQLDFEELSPPGGYGSDTYKKMVVSGNLPAMRDGELLLADSEAIAEYLNEKYPQPAMMPIDLQSRARVRERSRFHDTRLEPAARQLFTQISPDSRDDSFIRKSALQLQSRIDQLAVMLEGPEPFDALSLADCGYPITFAWIDALNPMLTMNIRWPSVISRWRERLESEPAIANELASYRPAMDQYIESQLTANKP